MKSIDTYNFLINGDCKKILDALQYPGRITLAYCDPPFNTGNRFEHYSDVMPQEEWERFILQRVQAVHRVLDDSGIIAFHIDNTGLSRSFQILDRIFKKQNFAALITWQRSAVSGLGQGGKLCVNICEYILFYYKDKQKFPQKQFRVLSPVSQKTLRGYRKIFSDAGSQELIHEFTAPSTGCPVKIYRHKEYKIETISWKQGFPEKTYIQDFNRIFRTFLVQKENQFQHTILSHCDSGLCSAEYISARGKYRGRCVQKFYLNRELAGFLADSCILENNVCMKMQRVSDLWTMAEVSSAVRREGDVAFDRSKKPESLMRRIIEMCTEEGETVLDPFGGSGTTAAAAMDLDRNWIVIEQGEHFHSVCRKRVEKKAEKCGAVFTVIE